MINNITNGQYKKFYCKKCCYKHIFNNKIYSWYNKNCKITIVKGGEYE